MAAVLEGRLVASVNPGRFAVDDAVSGPDLTSGRAVKLLIGGEWVAGRIEYASCYGGYYFIASDGGVYALCAGMRVKLSV